jgi:hypothetical protein
LKDIYNRNKASISQSPLISRKESKPRLSSFAKNKQTNKVKFGANSKEHIMITKNEKENDVTKH